MDEAQVDLSAALVVAVAADELAVDAAQVDFDDLRLRW